MRSCLKDLVSSSVSHWSPASWAFFRVRIFTSILPDEAETDTREEKAHWPIKNNNFQSAQIIREVRRVMKNGTNTTVGEKERTHIFCFPLLLRWLAINEPFFLWNKKRKRRTRSMGLWSRGLIMALGKNIPCGMFLPETWEQSETRVGSLGGYLKSLSDSWISFERR